MEKLCDIFLVALVDILIISSFIISLFVSLKHTKLFVNIWYNL
jgi:hypothetical protein